MIFPKNYTEGRRIVSSWAGEGTLETFYRTADGQVWRSDPSVTWQSHAANTHTCAPNIGRIVDGHIL